MLLAVVLLGAQRGVRDASSARLLGNAANVLFEGVIDQQLPEGATQEQVIDGLRAQGDDQLAEMLTGMRTDPRRERGLRADRTDVATLAVVYLIDSAFGWAQQYLMAGMRETMFRCARPSIASSGGSRCASSTTRRAATCSRTTNDIDNISTLQQASQIVWAVLTMHRCAGHAC